jgi:two-component system, NarL family, sensor kinase
MQDSAHRVILVVVVSMFMMLMLASFIIAMFFQYQKRQLLYYKNVDQLKSDYERNLLTAQLEMQEQTLCNISQEIHDNIGLSLTLAKLNLNSIESSNLATLHLLLSESKDLLTKAINDLSDLSKSFSADIIMNLGFLQSIEHEILRLRRILSYNIVFVTTGEPIFIESKVEVLLFRIFQECINNILKHARASVIDIQVKFASDVLALIVADNGVGFNVEETAFNRKRGAGIQNIRSRAELVSGITSITSDSSNGTKVMITIPIKQATI